MGVPDDPLSHALTEAEWKALELEHTMIQRHLKNCKACSDKLDEIVKHASEELHHA